MAPGVQAPIEEEEVGDAGQSFGGAMRRRAFFSSTPAEGTQQIQHEEKLADREAEQAQVMALAQNYVKCLQIMLQVGRMRECVPALNDPRSHDPHTLIQ